MDRFYEIASRPLSIDSRGEQRDRERERERERERWKGSGRRGESNYPRERRRVNYDSSGKRDAREGWVVVGSR